MNKYLFSMGLLVLASSAANAQPPVIVEGAPSERVSFADLDIGSHAGIQTLKARIKGAASRLCLTKYVDTLEVKLDERSCYSAAIGNAFGQMDRIAARRESGLPLVAMSIIVSAPR